MKRTIIIACLALVAATTLLVACKPQFTEQSSGTVSFPDAGVSLEVGDGWNRIDLNPGPPVCPPTLAGKHGIVRAMLFSEDRSDLEKAAASLKTGFQVNPEAIKDSFRQEEFETESGLHGIHLYYTSRNEKDGRTTEIRSHDYIVMNRAGRCVSISNIAPAESDSDVVQEMVRKSSKLL